MKKLFLILTLLAFAVMAKAQSGYFVSTTNGKTLDTVTNTGVRLQKLPIAGYQDVVSIQVNLTNISGTTAGVVRLYGSNDGTNFVRINATDSLVANANALTKIFVVSTSPYSYYRTGYTGVGTMAVKMQTYAIWRKR